MRHFRPVLSSLLLLLTACERASHAADRGGPPTVVIGPCHHAEFSGGCETISWPITGTLRGEIKAQLLRFANGKQQLEAFAAFSVDEMPIAGEVVLVLREGAPLGGAGERFVELRMPMARDPRAPAATTGKTWSSQQPSAAVKLPSTPRKTGNNGARGEMKCLPDQYNVMELWSQTHAESLPAFTTATPWLAQERELLARCVDGVEAIVLTLAIDLDAPSVPKSAR